MADTGNFADPSTFAGPPAGVPNSPGGSGLVHESVLAQPTSLIHESDLSLPTPQAPAPSPGQAPQMIHESDLGQSFGDQAHAAVGKMTAEIPGVEPLDLQPKPNSLVGKTMQFLATPLRAETGAVMKAAELLGSQSAAEWNRKFNPEGKLIPNAYMSDVSDFYIDKAAQAAGVPQIPGMLGDVARSAVTTAKFGVGLGANIVLDPLVGLKVGQLTKEAEEIQKIGGKVLNPEEVAQGKAPVLDISAVNKATQRNLVGYKIPLTDASIDVRGQAVQDAISKVGATAPVKALGTIIRALSPDTGDKILDTAGNRHDMLTQGDPTDIYQRYSVPKAALKMTSEEDRVASALVESTPNLAPPLPKGHLDAASEKPGFWSDEGTIRRQMNVTVSDTAKKLGIELPPGREDAIVEAAVMAKRADAENLMDKYHSGVLTPENIADKVIENHLPHVINPSYRGVKNLAEYEERIASDQAKVEKATSGSFLSSRDITRQRTMRGTLEEVNAKQKNAKGLDSYFITDPVAATTARLIESKKLLRDSQYLDVVKDYGLSMRRGEAVKQGLVSIDHPELEGKTVVLVPQGEGTAKVIQHKDLYYPKDVASKVQYRVARPALTGMAATIRDYNQVHRSIIFMTSPGMRFGNTLDNIFKTAAVTGKDFMRSSIDAVSVLLGKSDGFRSEPTALRPNGVFYDGKALSGLLDRYGIGKGGAWKEGMEAFINSGRKLTLQDAVQRPSLSASYAWDKAKNMIRWADTFGEYGEKSAQATLFLQRLRAGYEPDQAAMEVTKWLFNYNRNSPAMEAARFAMPFIQHPLKTAMIAPQLVGSAAGAYNFIQNSFPHLVANAFHDPITQVELNTVLPDSIKQRDGIAGPFISGNTWMAAILAGQNQKLGSLAWFDPRIGLRILNHFDYFSKGGTDRFVGETSPVIQSLLALGGRGDFGKSLDYANGNTAVANRASFALSKLIGGVSPFPNTEKMIMQAFGMVDPKHIEPNTVLIMKGMAGQFGGITDLDRDVQSKLLSAHYAYMDQKKQLQSVLAKEMNGNLKSNDIARYVKTSYGSITGMNPVDVYKQMTKSSQDASEASLGAQALGGGMTAGDFVTRMKGLSDQMQKLNQAYQVLGARYLQMSSGSKSPVEARQKAGMGH